MVLVSALSLAGCATSLKQEARQASETGADPTFVIASLTHDFDSIAATKRIFSVTLVEGKRRFSGEGAVEYLAEPQRLRVEVFGPQSTSVLRVWLADDILTVTLPQEDEVLVGPIGDPQFATLTGERALVSREILGALLGTYDVQTMLEGAANVSAATDGDRSILYIEEGNVVHALTTRGQEMRLTEYRQDRDGRLVYRVRFDDFLLVEDQERESPRTIFFQDFGKSRQLVIRVTREHSDIGELGG